MSDMQSEPEKEINRDATGRTHDTVKLGQTYSSANYGKQIDKTQRILNQPSAGDLNMDQVHLK